MIAQFMLAVGRLRIEATYMTDWIDDLRKKMPENERVRNDANARKRREGDLISGRAEEFFAGLREAFQSMAAELNDAIGATVGEVTCVAHHDRVIISNAGGDKAVVAAVFNRHGEQIDVSLQRKGALYVSGRDVKQYYRFSIDGDDRLRVARDRTDGPQEIYYQPLDLANALIQPLFSKLVERR